MARGHHVVGKLSMDLLHRMTEEPDLAECLDLVEDRFCYSPALWERVPDVTRRLLVNRMLNSAVLEDRDQPAGRRILQFGASVFVPDRYMRELAAKPAPHLGRWLIERLLTGEAPVLSLPEIRTANSGEGLNLVLLHFGFSRARITPEDWPAVCVRFPENFFFIHQGFQLKEITLEFCDPEIVAFSRDAGFHLRSDYADYYAKRGLPLPAPGRHPHRLGVSRPEAQRAPGTFIAQIFPYRRPRFGLTPAEQSLLLRAIQGDTDEEAARALHVALPTIKARWRTIYDRVERAAPDLLPTTGSVPSTRGGEKRRLLLNYLRQHLEELRPNTGR